MTVATAVAMVRFRFRCRRRGRFRDRRRSPGCSPGPGPGRRRCPALPASSSLSPAPRPVCGLRPGHRDASCCGPSLSPCARGSCRPCPSRDGSPCGTAAEEVAAAAARGCAAEAEQVAVAGSRGGAGGGGGGGFGRGEAAALASALPLPCRPARLGAARRMGSAVRTTRGRRCEGDQRHACRARSRRRLRGSTRGAGAPAVPPTGAASCAEGGRMRDRELNGACPSSARSSDGTSASTFCGTSPSSAARHR